MGGLLGISGLKVKSTNSSAYLLGGFSVGFILAYDKEDVSKYLVASFVFKHAEFGYVHTIYNEGISIPTYSNEYGSMEASGGSGNYQYNMIGF